MRVLHFAWTFSALTETFIYDPVQAVAGRVETLVVAHLRENAEARPIERLVLAGAYRGRLGTARDLLLAAVARDPTPGMTWVGVRRGLAAAVRSFRPDVIHAHFGDMGVLAAPVARHGGIPLLTSFYGYDASLRLRQPRWPAWYAPLAAGRNRVVVLSSDMARALVGAGLDGAAIAVVPTGKRLSDYRFRERACPPGRLVTVGRLVEKKGHLDAIETVGRLVREGQAVELEIVGEGPLEAALRSRVAALRLGGHVRLAGALDHPATRARMEAADAFLLCSRTAADGDREGVPTVLLEAQALGLPCISTRHAGIPEAIPAGNHWMLAPEGDVEGIAAALRRLRRASPEEIARASQLGLEHVRAHYELGAQVAALLEIYGAMAAASTSR